MKILRLSAGLLGISSLLLSGLAFADPPGAQPPAVPPPADPAAAPADSPAVSGPSAPPAAAPTAPAAGVGDKPSLPPPANKGKIDLSTPELEPRVQRSYHMHDGLYLRASLGIGSLSSRVDDRSPDGNSLHGSGASLHLNLLVGGTPTPGLAIGGALLAEGTADVDFDRNDEHVMDRSMSLTVLGPFVDGYPRPSRGWHLGGALGLAHLAFGSTAAEGRRATNGIGGAFWLGNDFWVGEDWSMGPLVKFTGALTQAKGDATSADLTAQAFSISILFTALYH